MAQYLRPISDTTTTGWFPTPIYATVDEASYDDSDYVMGNGQTCEVKLSNGTDPSVSTGHVIRVRGRGNPPYGSQWSVSLYQGSTLIKTNTYSNSSFTTQTYTLNNTETDSITDYSDLRLRFGGPPGATVGWAEFEIPDAGPQSHSASGSANLILSVSASGVATLGPGTYTIETPFTAFTNVYRSGSVSNWNLPTNAELSDDLYTRNLSAPLTNGVTDYLKCTGIADLIQSGAVIDGIEILIERRDTGNSAKDSVVQLVVGGNITGDNKANTLTAWPTIDTVATYGGTSDLWGLTITQADINASDFGVVLSATLFGGGFQEPEEPGEPIGP